jgi:DNA polymerase IV
LIVHIDIDAFFASVEQLLVPALRNRPVAVGSGCIASCSYEARARGLSAAMSLARARQLCRDLVVRKGSYQVYRCFAERIWELCREVSPAVDTYLDDAYLEMAGTERLYGVDFAGRIEELRQRINSVTGLTVSAGIGPNRMIARLAGRSAKPNGLVCVAAEEVEQFIINRPVGDIPGVGRKTQMLFNKLNIHSIRQLRLLQRRTLIELLGRNGSVIYDRARGRDTRPVSARELPVTISRESSLVQETTDLKEIRGLLYYLMERGLKALRAQGLVASRVGLRIRYADFQGEEVTRRLARSSDLEEEVFAMLLKRLYTRRVALRLVGVVFSGITVKRGRQLDLFEENDGRAQALAVALDEVRSEFGFSAITSGPALDLMPGLKQNRDGFVLRTSCLTK